MTPKERKAPRSVNNPELDLNFYPWPIKNTLKIPTTSELILEDKSTKSQIIIPIEQFLEHLNQAARRIDVAEELQISKETIDSVIKRLRKKGVKVKHKKRGRKPSPKVTLRREAVAIRYKLGQSLSQISESLSHPIQEVRKDIHILRQQGERLKQRPQEEI
jgi:biotin operon repressor